MKKPTPNEKLAELTADLQRTRADFENFRKQVERDKEHAKKISEYATVTKFLPLLDDLNRAISTYSELEPLKKSLDKTLGDLHLELMDTKTGTEFNPDFHEAISATGDGDRELIAETLRPGYYYDGEVLRPALVRVERTS